MECVLEPHKPSSAPADGRTGVRSDIGNQCNKANDRVINTFADTVPCVDSNTEQRLLAQKALSESVRKCGNASDSSVECSNTNSSNNIAFEKEECASVKYLNDINACPAMHDVEFYQQVAKELGVAAPVLHSVVYTHRHFVDSTPTKQHKPTEEQAVSVNDSNNGDNTHEESDEVEAWPVMRKKLNAELHKVNEHVWEWEARRVQEMEIKKLSANLYCEEALEEQMKRRIRNKREMEQMRAVNRMDSLTRQMAIDLQQMKVSLITHADKHACHSPSLQSLQQPQPYEKENQEETESNKDHECKDDQVLQPHAAKVHIAALREAQVAELTKHRLFRLEQERFLCSQGHDIGKLEIEQEEMRERRAINASCLSTALLISLTESEGKRRMLLENSECSQ